MMERLCWLALAVLHVLPGLAFFRPALLSVLYDVKPGGETFVLLQHRAGLFLAVAACCAWAAFVPSGRGVATLLAALSMGSFLVLYAAAGSPPAMRTIALADVAGLVPLAYVAWRAAAL